MRQSVSASPHVAFHKTVRRLYFSHQGGKEKTSFALCTDGLCVKSVFQACFMETPSRLCQTLVFIVSLQKQIGARGHFSFIGIIPILVTVLVDDAHVIIIISGRRPTNRAKKLSFPLFGAPGSPAKFRYQLFLALHFSASDLRHAANKFITSANWIDI